MVDWSIKQKSYFSNSYHSYNIMSGAVSSGKTFIANLRWYKHILEAPRNSLLIMVGKTSESLRDNTIKYILEMDNNFSLDETKMPMRLYSKHNNVEVACAGGDNIKSWERIQGKTTSGAYFDEVTNLPKELVQNVCKGCRHDGMLWPKFMTCNPDQPQHYIKKDYIENPVIDKRIWYFGLPDNPSLSDEYIAEVKQLYSGAAYDRMILGKWVQSEGVVFSEFDRDRHLYDGTIVNSIKEYVIGLDHGWSHPLSIHLYAVDYDGNYFVMDEIYKQHQHIDESLKTIMTQKGWFKQRVSYIYADSARPDLNSQLNKVLGIPIVPVRKDVSEGIQAVNSHFKKNKILIHNSKCPNMLNEIDSYVWKNKKGDSSDEPVKEHDDCMDDLRYTIFTRERSRVKIITTNPFARRR